MNTGISIILPALVLFGMAGSAHKKEAGMKEQARLYTFHMNTIDGKEKSLSEYKGKVILIVNVASKCGHTPQYAGLEELYKKYKERGFEILGFPANNFFGQEPGTDSEIKNFCSLTYGVTFDMFSKISVKGTDQHPLYQYLTKESVVPGEVKWNFQKYLVDRNGTVVAKFAPGTKPMEKEVTDAIESLLNQK